MHNVKGRRGPWWLLFGGVKRVWVCRVRGVVFGVNDKFSLGFRGESERRTDTGDK